MTAPDDPTTRRSEDTPEGNRRRKLVLRSVLPGDDTSLELDGTHFTLGRGEGCALQLAQTGTSRRHAEIERRGPVYSIRDLGSTNGTLVDGKPVTHAPLKDQSVVRLGE